MSKSSRDGVSGSKRRSFFALSALTPVSRNGEFKQKDRANVLRKRRTTSMFANSTTQLSQVRGLGIDDDRLDSPVQTPNSAKTPAGRPTSLFTSWKAPRPTDENEEPLSSTSSGTPSLNWEAREAFLRTRHVIHHGEVQTSSSMFRKKKEYLVLTETHIVRFKNYSKAAEKFSAIPSPVGKTAARHSMTPSASSTQDISAQSETSGELEVGTPLRQVIAVYRLEDGRPYFAFEVAYLDDESNHASSMTLQFSEPDDMESWLSLIRSAANRARHADVCPISEYNSKIAARAVERERDYEPPNYAIYKVVLRPSIRLGARLSTDDLSKVNSTVCFLAIGVHKVHIIPLIKPPQRTSSPSLGSSGQQSSYGLLALTALRVSETDDTFELTFRFPCHPPKVLYLASLASHDIAVRLRQVEEFLRPEWENRPYFFSVPTSVRDDMLSTPSPSPIEEDSFDRTLVAYCVAYNTPPDNIRYRISYPEEDGPKFELLKPANSRPNKDQYNIFELLAVLRALRYNDSFGTISFAHVLLDPLNGLHDPYGSEHVCFRTKGGTPLKLSMEELKSACVLVQEIRAIAVTNKRVRRMDFTSSIKRKPEDYMDEENARRDIGCGFVEALFPLCKFENTNVDWIILNNIRLGETDFDYIVGAAVERECHFRGLEMSNCGLGDRELSLIFDAYRAQDQTLEAINISGNTSRLSPATFENWICVFGILRKLNLSSMARTLGSEPLLSLETLLIWKLEELILSGTSLNEATVDALAGYLRSPQSQTLRELRLDHTYLTGRHVACLMEAMTEQPGLARELHLDVSENRIETGHRQFTNAIARGFAPACLTIKLLEYEDEALFRELVTALRKNTTIRELDISRASLPCEASDETCQALERMFAENSSLSLLNISGEDSRLETSRLGVGINRALCGLKRNYTLSKLYIQYQRLGLQGASTLADVLKINTGLLEVHCENNGIPLQGFTDLINALHRNVTLLYLPAMDESRDEALRQTEIQVKAIRDDYAHNTSPKSNSVRSMLSHKVHISKEKMPVSQLSDQDIQAAKCLVIESWDRQVYRLKQYLQRNIHIAQGYDVPLDIQEEEFERPDTATSFGRILQRVKFESTPTAEKNLQLGDGHRGAEDDKDTSDAVAALLKQLEVSLGT